jgi:hypothetical protein
MRRIHADLGTSFLVIHHDVRLAQRCDRTIELVDGRVERDVRHTHLAIQHLWSHTWPTPRTLDLVRFSGPLHKAIPGGLSQFSGASGPHEELHQKSRF